MSAVESTKPEFPVRVSKETQEERADRTQRESRARDEDRRRQSMQDEIEYRAMLRARGVVRKTLTALKGNPVSVQRESGGPKTDGWLFKVTRTYFFVQDRSRSGPGLVVVSFPIASVKTIFVGTEHKILVHDYC